LKTVVDVYRLVLASRLLDLHVPHDFIFYLFLNVVASLEQLDSFFDSLDDLLVVLLALCSISHHFNLVKNVLHLVEVLVLVGPVRSLSSVLLLASLSVALVAGLLILLDLLILVLSLLNLQLC